MTAPGPYKVEVVHGQYYKCRILGPGGKLIDATSDSHWAEVSVSRLNAAHAAGVQAERARIVEWLRKHYHDDSRETLGGYCWMCDDLLKLADELERAEG